MTESKTEKESETKEFYELKGWVETLASLVDRLEKRVDKLESNAVKRI